MTSELFSCAKDPVAKAKFTDQGRLHNWLAHLNKAYLKGGKSFFMADSPNQVDFMLLAAFECFDYSLGSTKAAELYPAELKTWRTAMQSRPFFSAYTAQAKPILFESMMYKAVVDAPMDVPTTMRAAVMTEYMKAMEDFNPAAMRVQEVPVPKVGEGEVLIKVIASSVNPVDWKFCSGRLDGWMPARFPMIPGFDCAGVVAAVGPGCSRLHVGDEVWADVVTREGTGEMHEGGGSGDAKQDFMRMGGYGEFVATSEKRVGLKPTNMTFDQAGTLPLVALTAYQALVRGNVQQGQTVLILGGSGGNGACAIQIARSMGATVYATCSSRNEKFVASLGANVINYTNQDWVDMLKGKDIDCIFDTVGPGADPDCLVRAGKVLKKDGAFVSILLHKTGKLPDGMENHFVLTKSDDHNDLDTLKCMCEKAELVLPIQQTLPLDQVQEGFKVSMGGRVVGKVCIRVSAL
jgi:NADPH:quinone reductase-like Zn-dependent oxidoreductase